MPPLTSLHLITRYSLWVLSALCLMQVAEVAEAAPGQLRVHCPEKAAEILVNGKNMGKMSAHKYDEMLFTLPEGTHQIEAQYETGDIRYYAKRSVYISDDTEQTINLYPRGGIAPQALQQIKEAFGDAKPKPSMVKIKGGSYVRGDNRYANEGPQHEVKIADFEIGRFEVTIADWGLCVVRGGCSRFEDDLRKVDLQNPRWPVTRVNWQQVQDYIAWLSASTGVLYRLPTDAEWEYVAGAGEDAHESNYSYGGCINRKLANFDNSSNDMGSCPSEETKPALKPVGSHPANALGVHDMNGNASEWVLDCWVPHYFNAPASGKPLKNGLCQQRTVRGGDYASQASELRTSARAPKNITDGSGFRLARSLP